MGLSFKRYPYYLLSLNLIDILHFVHRGTQTPLLLHFVHHHVESSATLNHSSSAVLLDGTVLVVLVYHLSNALRYFSKEFFLGLY
jgi:hypothetical protein